MDIYKNDQGGAVVQVVVPAPSERDDGKAIVYRKATDRFGFDGGADVRVTPSSGTGITLVSAGNQSRQIYKVTVDYTAFAAAALTADLVIAVLPAKTRLVNILADVTTKFIGGAVATATLKVGKSAGGVEYLASGNIFTAAITLGLTDAQMGTELVRAAAINGGAIVDWASPISVYARVTTTTANTNALTQGVITFYVITERF